VFIAKNGPCECFFCLRNEPHFHPIAIRWEKRAHRLANETNKQATLTKICVLCEHEELEYPDRTLVTHAVPKEEGKTVHGGNPVTNEGPA